MLRKKHKHEFIVCPCPWCNKTPVMHLYGPGYEEEYKDVWFWDIRCDNSSCLMQPVTGRVAVRRTSKYHLGRQIEKVNKLVNRWNTGNPRPAKEKIIVEFDINLEKFEMCKSIPGFVE